jgi:hypothetical protein
MKAAFSSEQFAVFDDFLGAAEYERLWRFIQAEPYVFMHPRGSAPDYPCSALTLRGKTPYLSRQVEIFKNARACPAGSPVEPTMRKIATSDAFTPWLGVEDVDFDLLTALPLLQPAGSGLPWHTHQGAQGGSYALYLHPTWRSHWGGELLIAGTQGVDTGDPAMEAQVMALAAAHAILPRPNRLVVIAARVAHCVRAVESAAGDHLRVSLTGFPLQYGPLFADALDQLEGEAA